MLIKLKLNVAISEHNFKEDYRSLLIRCEALETESDAISETLRNLQKDMEKEKTQITNITKEEQRLLSEIESLQQRVKDLGAHKKEYEDKCKSLEKSYSDDSRRLSMVQQNLRSLKKEAEKVVLFFVFFLGFCVGVVWQDVD